MEETPEQTERRRAAWPCPGSRTCCPPASLRLPEALAATLLGIASAVALLALPWLLLRKSIRLMTRNHPADSLESGSAGSGVGSPDSFERHDMMMLVGYEMSRSAAQMVYEQAGIGPDELDVVELHDCFAQNELITYEALGLCPEGEAPAFIASGGNTYGGETVTNPSGGLLSKGHPLGATGLAQCFELTHQLRGTADQRQVPDARVGLQHNLGLGGACVVTLYQSA